MQSLSGGEKPWVTKLSSAGLVYYHFGQRIISILTGYWAALHPPPYSHTQPTPPPSTLHLLLTLNPLLHPLPSTLFSHPTHSSTLYPPPCSHTQPTPPPSTLHLDLPPTPLPPPSTLISHSLHSLHSPPSPLHLPTLLTPLCTSSLTPCSLTCPPLDNGEESVVVATLFDKVYENFIEEVDAIDNGIAANDEPPR